MTDQDERARYDSWIAIGVRTDVPHPARVYNYGRELVDPGVVQISYWHPDGGTPAPNADKVWGYAGVGRV